MTGQLNNTVCFSPKNVPDRREFAGVFGLNCTLYILYLMCTMLYLCVKKHLRFAVSLGEKYRMKKYEESAAVFRSAIHLYIAAHLSERDSSRQR